MRQVLCPVLVGREREARQLRDALTAAEAGRGGTVLLAGEPGIGKSRLVRETAGDARGRGLAVLTGRAVAGGVPTPFRPFAEALVAAGRAGGLPDSAELDPFRPALGRLVPEWRPPPGTAADESLVVLGEAVLRLLRVLAPGAGCLLVLEDLHWADGETLALLEYLADNLAAEPVLCLGTLRRLLARSGIGPDSTVVCYGYAPAMGLWLMKLYGHADVRILDCSRDAWIRADHAAVRARIYDPVATLLDVRTRTEYAGECFWPSGSLEPSGRAGHIPSAVHQPLGDLYDERGSFRSPAELRHALPAVDLHGADEVITYCTIGGRASTAWFVLTYLLGRDHVRVYDGSWAEWGRMPDTPVAQP